MLVGTVFPDKQPIETFIVEIDFANELEDGEMIIDQTASAVKLSDGADATNDFLAGGAGVFEIAKVRVRVFQGLSGEIYRVAMTINTSNENTYQHEIDVPVFEV